MTSHCLTGYFDEVLDQLGSPGTTGFRDNSGNHPVHLIIGNLNEDIFVQVYTCDTHDQSNCSSHMAYIFKYIQVLFAVRVRVFPEVSYVLRELNTAKDL